MTRDQYVELLEADIEVLRSACRVAIRCIASNTPMSVNGTYSEDPTMNQVFEEIGDKMDAVRKQVQTALDATDPAKRVRPAS